MKNCIYLSAVGVVSMTLAACSGNSKSAPAWDSELPVVDTVVVEEEPVNASSLSTEYDRTEDESAPETAQVRYEKAMEIAKAGKAVWYVNGTTIWMVGRLHEEYREGYQAIMYEYFSDTDTAREINLNKTEQEDEAMVIEDAVVNNGVFTFIETENRNSNGWVEGTYVWQYDCKTGMWNAIARACSGAEFVNGGKAVKLAYAECINPDAECTADMRYRTRYKTVRL